MAMMAGGGQERTTLTLVDGASSLFMVSKQLA